MDKNSRTDGKYLTNMLLCYWSMIIVPDFVQVKLDGYCLELCPLDPYCCSKIQKKILIIQTNKYHKKCRNISTHYLLPKII